MADIVVRCTNEKEWEIAKKHIQANKHNWNETDTWRNCQDYPCINLTTGMHGTEASYVSDTILEFKQWHKPESGNDIITDLIGI